MKAIQIKDIVTAVSGTLAWGNQEAVVSHVSIDSREVKEGTLFVPIIGERVDAHRFIPDVLSAGAACVFSSDHTVQGDTGACIYVEDTHSQSLPPSHHLYMSRRHLSDSPAEAGSQLRATPPAH